MRDIVLKLQSVTLTHLRGRLHYSTGQNFKMPRFRVCTFLNTFFDDDMKRARQAKNVE